MTVIVLMKTRNAAVSKITEDLMIVDHHRERDQNQGKGKNQEGTGEGAALMNQLKNSIDQKSFKDKT